MVVFLPICAGLEFLAGLAVIGFATSHIHQTGGMLAIGLAVLTTGQAAILREVKFW